ncbi:hypothetical protein Emed_004933 [Eimeria media]
MVGRQQQDTQQDAGAPAGGPPQGPLPSVAHKVLDRQIRLWGLEAQKKDPDEAQRVGEDSGMEGRKAAVDNGLLEARVLVVGLSAVNVEASKDLALAEASKQGLESIASFVSFSVLPPEALGCTSTSASGASQKALEDLVSQYACVCVAAEVLPTHTLGALAAACRKSGVGLIVSQCCGTIGFFIQDFGIYELSPFCRRVKKEEGAETTVSHPPLLGVLSSRLRELDPKVDPAIYAVLALLRFEANHPAPRRSLGSIDPLGAEEAAKIEAAAVGVLTAEGLNPLPSMQRAVRDLAFGYNQQTNATAAVVGGLLVHWVLVVLIRCSGLCGQQLGAQEVRKYITREQKAVPNVVVFDSIYKGKNEAAEEAPCQPSTLRVYVLLPVEPLTRPSLSGDPPRQQSLTSEQTESSSSKALLRSSNNK